MSKTAIAKYYIGSEANAELLERGAVLCAVTAKPVSRDDVPLYSQPVAAQPLLIALQKVVDYYGYAEFGPIADARIAIAEYQGQAIAQPVATQGERDALNDSRAAFEAWATRDGTYDLRPAKVKMLSVGGVPYDGYARPYLQDRTMHAYEGFVAALAILAAKGGPV